ncbi:hypothetical protein [Candidatus Williamhamiltonella defendens]|nr:hypothetical protein [Candidatus Hamiltonella defensa]
MIRHDKRSGRPACINIFLNWYLLSNDVPRGDVLFLWLLTYYLTGLWAL